MTGASNTQMTAMMTKQDAANVVMGKGEMLRCVAMGVPGKTQGWDERRCAPRAI